MTKFEIVYIAIVIIGVIGLIYMFIVSPSPSTNFYKDQMIVCNTEDQWGLNNAKTTCYKVEEIK